MTTSDITAISSTVIALIALFVALWSMFVQRSHNRLSVTPHIDIIYGNIEYGIFALRMVNNGIGPARITGFSVIIEGKIIRPLQYLSIWQSAAIFGEFHLPANENVPTIGQFFSPGCSLMLLDYGPEHDIDAEGKTVEEAANLIAEFEKALGHITVIIAYESLYKDKYTTVWSLKTNIHQHVN